MTKTAKFDRQHVVALATNLYWKKGFYATSMRNLQDEIDMRPGSIYATFGSKDGLFKEALRNYTDIGIAQVAEFKNAHDSPMQALKAFVKYQVIETKETAPSGMCMLTKTISELTEDNQALIDIAKEHLSEIAREFAQLITQAQAKGEIAKQKSAATLAHYVQVQIAGLRSFAKINDDEQILVEMIDGFFAHYPFADA